MASLTEGVQNDAMWSTALIADSIGTIPRTTVWIGGEDPVAPEFNSKGMKRDRFYNKTGSSQTRDVGVLKMSEPTEARGLKDHRTSHFLSH